ncbi:uncharacterized protein LOC106173019 isoform X1 [Lingula anatina]|uniref:Uncharacterized protein LOC106173019 isoform X1 n=2 Tax=Lingula anatina TaxID=7574 RepID=A0A1S3JGF8_LINAN|nr:uncharacterized protein LOC106173019 isoform X1 [Lingula anatina]|eukprot:XP_013409443.1 uncharacterized protein LOC106173019 isoform X1 [Lingula anatina]
MEQVLSMVVVKRCVNHKNVSTTAKKTALVGRQPERGDIVGDWWTAFDDSNVNMNSWEGNSNWSPNRQYSYSEKVTPPIKNTNPVNLQRSKDMWSSDKSGSVRHITTPSHYQNGTTTNNSLLPASNRPWPDPNRMQQYISTMDRVPLETLKALHTVAQERSKVAKLQYEWINGVEHLIKDKIEVRSLKGPNDNVHQQGLPQLQGNQTVPYYPPLKENTQEKHKEGGVHIMPNSSVIPPVLSTYQQPQQFQQSQQHIWPARNYHNTTGVALSQYQYSKSTNLHIAQGQMPGQNQGTNAWSGPSSNHIYDTNRHGYAQQLLRTQTEMRNGHSQAKSAVNRWNANEPLQQTQNVMPGYMHSNQQMTYQQPTALPNSTSWVYNQPRSNWTSSTEQSNSISGPIIDCRSSNRQQQQQALLPQQYPPGQPNPGSIQRSSQGSLLSADMIVGSQRNSNDAPRNTSGNLQTLGAVVENAISRSFTPPLQFSSPPEAWQQRVAVSPVEVQSASTGQYLLPSSTNLETQGSVVENTASRIQTLPAQSSSSHEAWRQPVAVSPVDVQSSSTAEHLVPLSRDAQQNQHDSTVTNDQTRSVSAARTVSSCSTQTVHIKSEYNSEVPCAGVSNKVASSPRTKPDIRHIQSGPFDSLGIDKTEGAVSLADFGRQFNSSVANLPSAVENDFMVKVENKPSCSSTALAISGREENNSQEPASSPQIDLDSTVLYGCIDAESPRPAVFKSGPKHASSSDTLNISTSITPISGSFLKDKAITPCSAISNNSISSCASSDKAVRDVKPIQDVDRRNTNTLSNIETQNGPQNACSVLTSDWKEGSSSLTDKNDSSSSINKGPAVETPNADTTDCLHQITISDVRHISDVNDVIPDTPQDKARSSGVNSPSRDNADTGATGLLNTDTDYVSEVYNVKVTVPPKSNNLILISREIVDFSDEEEQDFSEKVESTPRANTDVDDTQSKETEIVPCTSVKTSFLGIEKTDHKKEVSIPFVSPTDPYLHQEENVKPLDIKNLKVEGNSSESSSVQSLVVENIRGDKEHAATSATSISPSNVGNAQTTPPIIVIDISDDEVEEVDVSNNAKDPSDVLPHEIHTMDISEVDSEPEYIDIDTLNIPSNDTPLPKGSHQAASLENVETPQPVVPSFHKVINQETYVTEIKRKHDDKQDNGGISPRKKMLLDNGPISDISLDYQEAAETSSEHISASSRVIDETTQPAKATNYLQISRCSPKLLLVKRTDGKLYIWKEKYFRDSHSDVCAGAWLQRLDGRQDVLVFKDMYNGITLLSGLVNHFKCTLEQLKEVCMLLGAPMQNLASSEYLMAKYTEDLKGAKLDLDPTAVSLNFVQHHYKTIAAGVKSLKERSRTITEEGFKSQVHSKKTKEQGVEVQDMYRDESSAQMEQTPVSPKTTPDSHLLPPSRMEGVEHTPKEIHSDGSLQFPVPSLEKTFSQNHTVPPTCSVSALTNASSAPAQDSEHIGTAALIGSSHSHDVHRHNAVEKPELTSNLGNDSVASPNASSISTRDPVHSQIGQAGICEQPEVSPAVFTSDSEYNSHPAPVGTAAFG